MPATDHTSTLGGIVLEQPRAAALFERFGLDYCCGGRLTLEEACGQRGLHALTVATLLQALDDEPGDAEVHDVARASMHQHVHEENNVLFPRVRARIAA